MQACTECCNMLLKSKTAISNQHPLGRSWLYVNLHSGFLGACLIAWMIASNFLGASGCSAAARVAIVKFIQNVLTTQGRLESLLQRFQAQQNDKVGMERVIGIHELRANFHLAGKISKTVEVLTILS